MALSGENAVSVAAVAAIVFITKDDSSVFSTERSDVTLFQEWSVPKIPIPGS